MNKHTPGPWACSNEGWGDGMADVRGPGREQVCRIPIFFDCPSGDGDTIDNEFFRGDRALILASPDLLEACEAHMSALNSQIRDGKDRPEYAEAIYQAQVKMRKAIAKARGGA